jgi:TM2 domain-containing membrane protein YozV
LSAHKSQTNIIKGTAILLSIAFPGLGHIYLGQYKKGFVFYLLAFLIVVYPVIWILALIDIVIDKGVLANEAENPFSKRKNVLAVALLGAPVSFAFLMFLSLQVYSFFNNCVLAERRTLKEMTEMETSIVEYEQHYGRYPVSIDELVSIKPVREGWKRDYWNSSYYFSSTDSGYVIISPGKDRKLHTEDDLRMSYVVSSR